MSLQRRLPKARSSANFVVEELDGEVLLYDQETHRAHCLTPIASRVWKMCEDGVDRVHAADIVAASGGDLEAVISELDRAGLLAAPRRARIDRSRRAMLGKTVAAAAVVVASPIIFSIVAPSVAEAASSVGCGKKTQPCCQPGNKCNAPLLCKSGVCQ
jgi:hypothetical protein